MLLMVNNEDIYVLTEPLLYCNHSVLVEQWLSVEGRAFKEIIIWSCNILHRANYGVNYHKLITLM